MLRREDADLLVLRRIFEAMPQTVEALVPSAPTARRARRIWFFYETLT